MKKSISVLISMALAFALCSALYGCGGKDNEPQTHNITYQTSENYTVTGLASAAEAGELITFEVESSSVFYTIEKVTVNGEEISEGPSGYSFAMPDNDVDIEITAAFVGEYDDPDDHLAWGADVTGTIAVIEGGDTETEIALEFPGASSYITDIDAKIYSSDKSVIPSSAISFVPEKSASSGTIPSGHLTIDLEDVHAGTTYIYLDLDPNNGSLGRLIKKFTVVENQLIKVETMPVQFTYTNNTDYDEEHIFVNFTDLDYIANSDAPEKVTVYLTEFTDGTYSFNYAVGHTYLVSCAYSVYDEEEGRYDMTSLTLNEWHGTNLGGENFLESAEYNGFTLSLTASGITVPLTIRTVS